MATANRSDSIPIPESARLLIAVALVLMGLYLAAFGNSWVPLVLELLPASEFGAWLELIVPFLPMLFIGFAAVLFASCRASYGYKNKNKLSAVGRKRIF